MELSITATLRTEKKGIVETWLLLEVIGVMYDICFLKGIWLYFLFWFWKMLSVAYPYKRKYRRTDTMKGGYREGAQTYGRQEAGSPLSPPPENLKLIWVIALHINFCSMLNVMGFRHSWVKYCSVYMYSWRQSVAKTNLLISVEKLVSPKAEHGTILLFIKCNDVCLLQVGLLLFGINYKFAGG